MKTEQINRMQFVMMVLSLVFVSSLSVQATDADLTDAGDGFYRHGMFNHWNPAVLGIKAGPRLAVFGPSFTTSFGNNAFSPQYIGDNFTDGKVLTPTNIDDILSQMKNDELGLSLRGDAPVLGLSYGKYGFKLLDYNINGSAAIPQDIFELIMSGWQVNKLYNFVIIVINLFDF